MNNIPPFTLTNKLLTLVADISEKVGRLSVQFEREQNLRLRKVNRMRTIQGSLAIEGNTLSQEQVTAIIDGKRVIAPVREVQEASNAISAYEKLNIWEPSNGVHLLEAHQILMMGLNEQAGVYRSGGVGVMSGKQVVHMAPQAERVPKLMGDLLQWLETAGVHPLIASCVFHYELEFIHPFADGNGRMGRLWQSLILSHWHGVFAHLPVESLVHQHQEQYYQAIRSSTVQSNSVPFIEFMLGMIVDALNDGVSDGVNDGVKLDSIDQLILELLANKPNLTQNELMQKIAKSKSTVERRMRKLKQKGFIMRIGGDKNGHWQVVASK